PTALAAADAPPGSPAPPAPQTSPLLADASARIDAAIEDAVSAEAERNALRGRTVSARASFDAPRARSWGDLHAQAPVLPTSAPGRLANELPLAAIVEALDRSRIDWLKWDAEVLTLAVAGRNRAFTRAGQGE